MADVINLDEGVEEFTPFILLGHTYLFRQFNTQEAQEIIQLSEAGKNEEINLLLEKFITPKDEGTPPFPEIKDRLLIGHYRNLKKMIYAIMGVDERKDNQS